MEKMELVKRLTELEDDSKTPRPVIPDKFRIRSPNKKSASKSSHGRSTSSLPMKSSSHHSRRKRETIALEPSSKSGEKRVPSVTHASEAVEIPDSVASNRAQTDPRSRIARRSSSFHDLPRAQSSASAPAATRDSIHSSDSFISSFSASTVSASTSSHSHNSSHRKIHSEFPSSTSKSGLSSSRDTVDENKAVSMPNSGHGEEDKTETEKKRDKMAKANSLSKLASNVREIARRYAKKVEEQERERQALIYFLYLKGKRY